MRTTIDIDDPVMKDLKRLQRREGKSLGQLVSELLALALASKTLAADRPGQAFHWTSKAMGARVDLSDKHALLDAMDRPPR